MDTLRPAFGIHRTCAWIVPGGGSLGGGAALLVLAFGNGGLIGDFILFWRLLVAAWYVPPHRLPHDRGITAPWKCGKRPLRRWKTDIPGPMGKPPAFPQSANIVSHNSAFPTVSTHSHSACYCGYSSCLILVYRKGKENKKSGSVTLGSNQRRRSRFHF